MCVRRRERESVCVCVCSCDKDRERERVIERESFCSINVFKGKKERAIILCGREEMGERGRRQKIC